ncbi:hypothetical protein BH09MYX1_BH09MYX1_42670 [soil metagenome]
MKRFLAWASAVGLVCCAGSRGATVPPIIPTYAPIASAATDAGDGIDAATLTASPRYDWVGIIGTGQSLAVGSGGRPVITTTQPFHNLKLTSAGPMPEHPLDEGLLPALVPLVEPIRAYGHLKASFQYPNNIFGETPHSAMANQLSAIALDRDHLDYVTIHTVVGWGGRCIRDIDKRGRGYAYPSSLWEARTIKGLADAQGKSFVYGAITLTHGECDATNERYEDQLHELWQDYDTDIKAITGQKERIPLLVSQQCTFPADGTASASTLAAWSAGVRYPGDIVCIGPKYQYSYLRDHVHFDAASYRRLGEKYAEVFDILVRQRKPWAPLQPSRGTRVGAVVTLDFHVPNPPLAWDESLAPPHQGTFTEWARGRGFEVESARGPLTIANVEIRGESVVITLKDDPQSPVTVGYAVVADAKVAAGGEVHGRRGQLRDSDPFVGWDAETIPCAVEHGSNVITAATSMTFAKRNPRDLVIGPNFPGETIIRDKVTDGTLALSAPWEGASGTVALAFHYDLRNYAVAFRIAVP